MDYKIITNNEDFANLKEDWQTLENQSTDVTVFSTFDYCFAWWEIYQHKPDLNLWIIIIVNNNKIIGVAPLMIEKLKITLGFKIYIVKFLARGDYHNFIIDEASDVKPANIYKLIFTAIEDNGDKWDRLSLTHISHKSFLTQFIFKSKYNSYYTYLIENPIIKLNDYTEDNSIDRAKVPSKALQYANRLHRKVKYNFKCNAIKIEDCGKIHQLEKLFLQDKGLLQRFSLLEDTKNISFYELLARKQLLYIFSLNQVETDEILIYNLGYIRQSIFFSVNTAYNPKYANLSVGRVMYFELINHGIQSKMFDYIDTGTGRYPWKFEWTPDFNLLYQLNINKPRSKSLAWLYQFKALINQ